MTVSRKTRKHTNLNVKLTNDAINFQFEVELPTPYWWWLLLLAGAAILVWRPELTDYIKAVIALVQP